MHIHVHCSDGEAKYSLDPEIRLAKNYGLSSQQLSRIVKIVQEHKDELIGAWNFHFRD
ncbi:MAG: hypothetical protein ACI9LO_002431 [Planctomycetota bacterium]|jgi:hypothetical protein